MAYTALYRKFRPDTFSEVKGQDPIVTTLKNQIRSGRVGHAYLFCGTRGTGKTTVAKLLAKAINCEHPVDGDPCGECAQCRAIAAGASLNVVEIDAASNNGVENIREIVEEVRYSPTEGKYRVYIIDEVHMLSAGAFNALLKTLEEPPSYVVFLLATTEAHKIPITILSRCQRYDFKRIPLETIAARLQDLCEREGVPTEERAMRYLAKAADGSMRDALSLLERCVAFYFEETLTYDKVLEVLGSVDIDVFSKMLRYVRQGAVTDCMTLLDEMVTEGRELPRFVVDFTWYLRNLLLAKSGEDISELLEVSGEQMQVLIHESSVFATEDLLRYIHACGELTNRLRYAVQKRILIETAFIRLCRPQMETDYDSLLQRVRQLEETLEEIQRRGVTVPQTAGLPQAKEEIPGQEVPAVLPALPEDVAAIAAQWKAIVHRMPPPGRECLISCRPSVTENGKLLLLFDNAMDYEFINKEERLAKLRELIAIAVGKEAEFELRLLDRQESMQGYADITVLNRRLKHIVIEETE